MNKRKQDKFDIHLSGTDLTAGLQTLASEWGLRFTESPGSSPVLEVYGELSEKVWFDWNYLFSVLYHHLSEQKERPLRFFHLPIDEDSSREKLFVPGEMGEVEPVDESWIDGGVESGVRFRPTKATDDLFAWLPLFSSSILGRRPALFLDRDGILNRDRGYVSRIEDLVWHEEIFPLISQAREQGHEIVILTNQSGIARGLYSVEEMTELHKHMDCVIRERTGAGALAWYYCPYHSNVDSPLYGYKSISRKPLPGMLLRACAEHSLDLTCSTMLGDKETDRFRGIDLETWLLESVYLDPVEAKSNFRARDWQNAIPPHFISSLKEFRQRLFSRES